MALVTKKNVEDIIAYHAPSAEGLAKIQKIRDGAKAFIEIILDNAPTCADQTVAVRHVRDAMMNANASIVLEGKI